MLENGVLKNEIENLLKENKKMKEELSCVQARCTLECSTGSAESFHPLPKGHSSHLTKIPTYFLIQLFLQMIYIHQTKNVMMILTLHLLKNCLKTTCSNTPMKM